jgi:hypothetical protein
MKFLSKVWNDIRRGKNIAQYVTIVTALGLAFFNLIGKAPDTLLTPLTLAVLALITIESLVARHHIDELFDQLRKSVSDYLLFPDQLHTNQHLTSYLKDHHIKEAKLIEYSCDSIKPVVLALLESGTNVHLLLQHPDFAISNYQRTKLSHQIQSKEMDFVGFSDRLRIDYYMDIASIRARKFDSNLICVGWYTYDRRIGKDEPEVWGHPNPAIILKSTDHNFETLNEMFITVFKNLLENSESYDTVKQKHPLLEYPEGLQSN